MVAFLEVVSMVQDPYLHPVDPFPCMHLREGSDEVGTYLLEAFQEEELTEMSVAFVSLVSSFPGAYVEAVVFFVVRLHVFAFSVAC